jgi:hypothetical protein
MMIETIIHIYFTTKGIQMADLFLPLESSDQLLRAPIMETMTSMANLKNNTPAWGYATASLGWIAAYYIIGRIRLLHSDW